MTYGQLRALVQETVLVLRQIGLTSSSRVAIVMDNGPETASAFMAIAGGAVTAPLNPAYRQEEYEFYLADLRASALVVAVDYQGPALAAAKNLGTAVVRLQSDPAKPAGWFSLSAESSVAESAQANGSNADDVALILHTSGTTSRPKIVPLLHRNLASSARHIGETLALTPSDRCLNVMPLFHIHGLIAAVLSSLSCGASVFCTPGFNALSFFGWVDDTKPTWYTAVPTMHQAILARAPRNQESIEQARLRFIRSSSASLPPQVMKALESTFGAPVIESYGMTEATHQMASNPLPPAQRKAGSVGIAAGPRVQIADQSRNVLLKQGDTGEVVISGPNVTPGYEGNETANADAFFVVNDDRWFRTGDQGVQDEHGYLRITGRLKEIINRGGEKVSPLEVDEILMDHPSIAQVVTFAIPHKKLGEEVAAAIVLREGETVSEKSIREFASSRLADFKVPKKVIILDEIPKGATGKMQRIGLAEKLGLAQ